MQEVQQHLRHVFILVDDVLDVVLQFLSPLLWRFGPQVRVPFAREVGGPDDFSEFSVQSLELAASSEHKMFPLIEQDFNSEKLFGLS